MEETVLRDMDIRQILQYHNCKYPCLMIDHMEEVVPGKSARGYKTLHIMNGFSLHTLRMTQMFPVLSLWKLCRRLC